MTPKQQDERSLDAVTRKVADDYFRLCHESGDKPMAAGLWTAHLQSALLNNLKALSAHLEAQGDVAKDAAQRQPRATDKQIQQWAERNDLTFGGSAMDARAAFEDAQTLMYDLEQFAIARNAIATDAEAKP